MIEWIEKDKLQIEQLPRGPMWSKGLFTPFQDKLSIQSRNLRRALHKHAIFIVEEEWRSFDIFIKYKDRGITKEVIYTLPMLEAEAIGLIEKLGNTRSGK